MGGQRDALHQIRPPMGEHPPHVCLLVSSEQAGRRRLFLLWRVCNCMPASLAGRRASWGSCMCITNLRTACDCVGISQHPQDTRLSRCSTACLLALVRSKAPKCSCPLIELHFLARSSSVSPSKACILDVQFACSSSARFLCNDDNAQRYSGGLARASRPGRTGLLQG